MAGREMAAPSDHAEQAVTPNRLRSVVNPSLWILGPWADLLLIIGTPVVIFLVFVLARRVWTGAQVSAFVMIWAVGHHLPGMMRAYGDPDLFGRFRVRFVVAPVLLLLACSFALLTTIDSGLFAIAATWGLWHYLMQAYGFVRIYDSKVRSFDATTRWLDQAMCLVWFVAAVILNDNTLHDSFVERLYNSGMAVPSPAFFQGLRSVTIGLTAAVTFLFIVDFVRHWMAGRRPSPVKPFLMIATFGAFWYSAATVTNIVVAYAFFELFHDVQYLTIVWAFNRNRVQKDKSLHGFTRFLFQPRIIFVALYLALIFGYGSLKYGSTLVEERQVQRFLTAVFLMSTLLHYYFDGFIWKLREKATHDTLGIDDAEKSRRPFLDRYPWLRHGLLWSLFAIPFAVLMVSQVVDAMDRAELTADQQISRRVVESDRLVECMPESVRANYALGLAREMSGDLAGAERQYRRTLELYPQFIDAQAGLERISAR